MDGALFQPISGDQFPLIFVSSISIILEDPILPSNLQKILNQSWAGCRVTYTVGD